MAGQKLEKARATLESARETQNNSLEMAQEDASEMKDIRSMLGEVPRDIDTDLLENIDKVAEDSTEEGVNHMETEVHGVLEEGSKSAEGVADESREQQELSNEASETFNKISDTRFAGSSAESAETARERAEEFSDTAEMADESIETSQNQYEQLLQEVEG